MAADESSTLKNHTRKQYRTPQQDDEALFDAGIRLATD